MAKLNLPNIIEICSNNNEHIITESIKNLLDSTKKQTLIHKNNMEANIQILLTLLRGI